MKKSIFITIFIGAHVGFVFLQIHQYSRVIQTNYDKQKLETTKITLIQKKQELTHQLYALHNKSSIKQFAVKNLAMEPVQLSQIKRLNKHDQTI